MEFRIWSKYSGMLNNWQLLRWQVKFSVFFSLFINFEVETIHSIMISNLDVHEDRSIYIYINKFSRKLNHKIVQNLLFKKFYSIFREICLVAWRHWNHQYKIYSYASCKRFENQIDEHEFVMLQLLQKLCKLYLFKLRFPL